VNPLWLVSAPDRVWSSFRIGSGHSRARCRRTRQGSGGLKHASGADATGYSAASRTIAKCPSSRAAVGLRPWVCGISEFVCPSSILNTKEEGGPRRAAEDALTQDGTSGRLSGVQRGCSIKSGCKPGDEWQFRAPRAFSVLKIKKDHRARWRPEAAASIHHRNLTVPPPSRGRMTRCDRQSRPHDFGPIFVLGAISSAEPWSDR
jgi:hypothetical protein